jgi:predicted DCC family thiol-disulfide oxidoreductase YuxK
LKNEVIPVHRLPDTRISPFLPNAGTKISLTGKTLRTDYVNTRESLWIHIHGNIYFPDGIRSQNQQRRLAYRQALKEKSVLLYESETQTVMNDDETSILLFDGDCNLCNHIVQFIIRRDPKGRFKFASLQSEKGQALLTRSRLPTGENDSVVYLKGDQFYVKSTAVIRVLTELGGILKLAHIFVIFPKSFRDFIYDRMAKSRYRVFGKSDSCPIPDPDLQSRFLL